jgi:hypothetical protein
MRRRLSSFVSLAGLAAVLAAAGCGGSGDVTGPDAGVPAGSAVLQGAILGAGLGGSSASSVVRALAGSNGWSVSVVSTSLTVEVDDDGRFVLAGVPAGRVGLRIEGPGVSGQVSVSGLLDGQVTSIEVTVTGGTPQLAGEPKCGPSADTFFSGILERMAGTELVVAGRPVDASQVKKVWRGDRRIQLSDLKVGEKVKVWGILRGDGVVVAEEIAALTTGAGDDGDVWVSFTGKVESVKASSLEFHDNPNSGSSPTIVVKGITVKITSETKVKHGDGSPMSPSEIKVGQTATVEGWKKPDKTVRATLVVIDGEGSGGKGTWVSFKGRVDSVAALSTGGDIESLDGDLHASCALKMTIAGRKVETDGSTVFRWSTGGELDPYAIVVGDQAYVEGWSKPEGYVLAAKVVVDKR